MDTRTREEHEDRHQGQSDGDYRDQKESQTYSFSEPRNSSSRLRPSVERRVSISVERPPQQINTCYNHKDEALREANREWNERQRGEPSREEESSSELQ